MPCVIAFSPMDNLDAASVGIESVTLSFQEFIIRMYIRYCTFLQRNLINLEVYQASWRRIQIPSSPRPFSNHIHIPNHQLRASSRFIYMTGQILFSKTTMSSSNSDPGLPRDFVGRPLATMPFNFKNTASNSKELPLDEAMLQVITSFISDDVATTLDNNKTSLPSPSLSPVWRQLHLVPNRAANTQIKNASLIQSRGPVADEAHWRSHHKDRRRVPDPVAVANGYWPSPEPVDKYAGNSKNELNFMLNGHIQFGKNAKWTRMPGEHDNPDDMDALVEYVEQLFDIPNPLFIAESKDLNAYCMRSGYHTWMLEGNMRAARVISTNPKDLHSRTRNNPLRGHRFWRRPYSPRRTSTLLEPIELEDTEQQSSTRPVTATHSRAEILARISAATDRLPESRLWAYHPHDSTGLRSTLAPSMSGRLKAVHTTPPKTSAITNGFELTATIFKSDLLGLMADNA